MVKLEKIIRGCTIGMVGVAAYIISLAIGYTTANYHLLKTLEYKYEAINSYDNGDRSKHEEYLELARMHKQKSEKWEELTKSVDLFHKLDLYR